ncbi:tail assembly protein [Conchiformibius steedae]|uniref:Tail assembly protein n=2 Tax=Conchiformibius steedae TaxID=153493 RepID=A0A3P2A645_9NEIS|nr:tail assembly protein [Conchiformibius steedae]
MITVRFHGCLKSYGSRFTLYADTPAEALRALFLQIDGLRQMVADGHFLVRLNGAVVLESEAEQVFVNPASGELHLIPRTAGAGRAGQLVAGVALIAFAWWNPFGWAASSALLTGITSAGIGLVAGGVAQMLARPPKAPTDRAGVAASRNSAFSNLDNTVGQGKPVPLAYGLVYCGSRVVSQGIETRRIGADAPAETNPIAREVNIRKTFVRGTAALAPNGQPYQTDFDNDSVRARNYTAVLIEKG